MTQVKHPYINDPTKEWIPFPWVDSYTVHNITLFRKTIFKIQWQRNFHAHVTQIGPISFQFGGLRTIFKISLKGRKRIKTFYIKRKSDIGIKYGWQDKT